MTLPDFCRAEARRYTSRNRGIASRGFSAYAGLCGGFGQYGGSYVGFTVCITLWTLHGHVRSGESHGNDNEN